MHYVYILKSKSTNNFHYIGLTSNLNKRLREHSKGKTPITKGYLPIYLVWYCIFNNRIRAAKFEKYLKSGSGRAFSKRHLYN